MAGPGISWRGLAITDCSTVQITEGASGAPGGGAAPRLRGRPKSFWSVWSNSIYASSFQMGASRLYVDSARFGINPRNNGHFFFVDFLRFLRLKIGQIFRAGLAASFGHIFSSNDQKLTDFVKLFRFCFHLFDPGRCENATFSLSVLKNRSRNHAQIVDLAILHKSGKSRALYDLL